MARATRAAKAGNLPAVSDMTNLLDKYLLANVDQDAMAEVLKENISPAAVSDFSFDEVKVPSGGMAMWQLNTIDGVQAQPEIEGVIVYHVMQRAYWETRLDDRKGGGATPPNCRSADGLMGTGNPGGSCKQCPLSKYGTSRNQDGSLGNGQACKQFKRLFMLTASGILPVIVNVPPTSIGPVEEYFRRLTSEMVPYFKVVTRLRLRQERSGSGIAYAEIEPSRVGNLSAEDFARVKPLREQFLPLMQSFRVEESA